MDGKLLLMLMWSLSNQQCKRIDFIHQTWDKRICPNLNPKYHSSLIVPQRSCRKFNQRSCLCRCDELNSNLARIRIRTWRVEWFSAFTKCLLLRPKRSNEFAILSLLHLLLIDKRVTSSLLAGSYGPAAPFFQWIFTCPSLVIRISMTGEDVPKRCETELVSLRN